MATLNVQRVSLSGLEPSFSNCDSGGDEFVNSGKAFIWIKNNDTSAHTVTIDSQEPCSYGYDHDVSVQVPAGEERLIGPFPKNRFNDSEGKVQISYDGVTNLQIAVIEIP